MKKPLVAASFLSADFLRVGEQVSMMEACGVDWHHIDVMDGHFVPNLTFGPPMLTALKRTVKIPLDVHVMISNPEAMALEYVKAGADYLTFHVEACVHPHRLIHLLKDHHCKVGIAVNPATSLHVLDEVLDYIDLVLVMSVNPGFGGQKFIHRTLKKLEILDALLKERGVRDKVLIEVDGGVNDANAGALVRHGADVLVSGNFLYNHADIAKGVQDLKRMS